MALHIISEKYNLKSYYSWMDEFRKLGVDFYTKGKHNHPTTLPLTDKTFFQYIQYDLNLKENISLLHHTYCQTKEFSVYLKYYFEKNKMFDVVCSRNKYKYRYETNNDVYVHVRLDDAKRANPGFEYYDDLLTSMNFDKGYISSDEIDNDICQRLIQKHKLNVIDCDEVETIMFASTCKRIVLSCGVFSWLIGFLGIHSIVYHPDPKKYGFWHGDIFVFPEWNIY
jgi:hypothetical protein